MNRVKKKVADIIEVTEVSTTTGEVITYEKTKYEQNEIQREIDYNKKRDELSATIRSEFGKYFLYFYNNIDKFDMPPNIKVRFLYLCTFIGYNGYLVEEWSKDRRYLTPMTRSDLASKLMLSDREFKTTIKALVDCGLLIIDEKYYKVNDGVVIRGETKKRKGYTRVFFDGVKHLYQNCKPTQHRQLYYFFMLLPYINLQHNVVCENIEEQMYENIIACDLKRICEICGYNPHDYNKFKNNLLKFKISEKDVVIVSYRGNSTFIRINPSIYYAGTRIEDLKDLMGQFGYKIG